MSKSQFGGVNTERGVPICHTFYDGVEDVDEDKKSQLHEGEPDQVDQEEPGQDTAPEIGI